MNIIYDGEDGRKKKRKQIDKDVTIDIPQGTIPEGWDSKGV
jgi:hypothetical protein